MASSGSGSGSGSALRRGLPRVPGGEPWPPAGVAPAGAVPAGAASAASTPVEVAQAVASEPANPQITPPESATALRRGLPRVPGGEPWPPAGVAPAGAVPSASATVEVAQAVASAPANPQITPPESGAALRRGLPRVPGGEPWPPEGLATAPVTDVATSVGVEPALRQNVTHVSDAGTSAPAPMTDVALSAGVEPELRQNVAHVPDAGVPAPAAPRAPLPFTRSVWPGRAATHRPAPRPEPARIGPFTKAQWAGAVVVGGLGLLFAAAMAVLFVRFLLSLDAMQDFLATYPGEYHLPDAAPVGIPAWLGWQHFFNAFLMVLIIRSGLTIRREKRPAVFWAPKNNPKGKTSLTIWFHQALDIFWLVNGVVFVVLLFVTGQWMRIVPTSWEVFPNALSAALQYVSLDWPTENGWVNYNSLQQVAYFSTVFLAAPLAAISGYRMSGMWPKGNAKLSAAYPIEWARKIHFPVMLYFVVFIVIHVALVLATGALRNLNHMYAAQGSVDPTAYADNWTGFWMFVLSLVAIAAAWVAARPLVLAPIARLFGTVSGR